MYKRVLKPVLDFLMALILIVLLSPVILVTSILLAFANNGKVFFFQPRPGLDGKIFKLIKFKTMKDSLDEKGNLLPDRYRITTVGKIVRKLSIDELPQLISVIKGDMSLIGPRPLLVKYLSYYSDYQHRRHEVKPGITGWAQVNGRNAIDWERKFELDIWYVDNISFRTDLKIFFMTAYKILKREGVDNSERQTMTPFIGSKN
jgi:undecaprenyl phosphate N,N'-diacetylbacillosamine 1-phosphate transferase